MLITQVLEEFYAEQTALDCPPYWEHNLLGQVLGWFEIYATEFANLDYLDELRFRHFEAYLSSWYLNKVSSRGVSDYLYHLEILKSFLLWLENRGKLSLDGELSDFDALYASLKLAMPRLLQLPAQLNQTQSKVGNKDRLCEFVSLFQVQKRNLLPLSKQTAFHRLNEKQDLTPTLELLDLYARKPNPYTVRVSASTWPLIQKGDLINLTLQKETSAPFWQVARAGIAYPKEAAPYQI